MVKVLVVELGPSRDTVLHMLVIVVSLSVLSFYLTSFTSAHAPSPGILVVDNTVVERRGARTIGEISVNRSFRDSEMAKMIDLYPVETLAAKKVLLPRAAHEGWLCLFYHDPDMPLCRLAEDNGNLRALDYRS